MRTRLIALASALLVMVLLAVPSLAQRESGPAMPPHAREQAKDFEAATAQEAHDRRNAPMSFAPCEDGMAADTFPCESVDLMSWLDHEALGVSFVNDVWGWTDSETGKDYALLGATEGTVFVDISDPKRPDVVGMLPAHTRDETLPFWRDIKVYNDHAFVVSEQSGHGMQVFDLTELRDAEGQETFTETAHYDGFSTAHNVAINTDSGYAYAVGTDTFEGGLHIVDVSEPTSPAFAGGFADHGYVHDTQCVDYEGPHTAYQGREICFNSNADTHTHEEGVEINNFLSVVDVTDKDEPEGLSRTPYANDGYSHQGWLTPDQAHFLHGDELDELSHGIPTTTRVWDVGDLEDTAVNGVFENDTDAIDHNIYTQGRYAYASNYTSGLRVYDITDVDDGELSEVGFFDVYPEHDKPIFEGTWSNYPYFRQKGIVAVSSIERGLFVLKPRVDRVGN